MKNKILLYGATGYTGRLIIEELLKRNIKPILGGRNTEQLNLLSKKYALENVVFELNDTHRIKSALQPCKAVIHAAGPFIHTYKNMLQACLESGTHYLDITGEYQVFEACTAKNIEAKNANVMVMPGVGFDVVPSDCLANHLHSWMPDATSLYLAFAALKGGFSRGTAKTMVENLGNGVMRRKDGNLTEERPGYEVREINFGPFTATAAAISWGDISTAYFSTKIPNITVYMAMPKPLIQQMKRSHYFNWFFRLPWIKSFLKKLIDKRKPGPDEQQRNTGKSYFWGCVENEKKERKELRLETPEGYRLTAITSALIADKVLHDQIAIGYQTPASAYGKNLILEVENCKFF
jgi:short subunit dehydrogenase-like uncharacterized protein